MTHSSQESITNLKKVTLSIQAGRTAEAMDVAPEPFGLQFIFGIGPQGYSPFEYALAEKKVGDIFFIPVALAEATQLFEHLSRSILQNLTPPEHFYLKVEVTGIDAAENREVVRAMAALAEGDGGDCGCGGGCGCSGSH